MSAKEFLFSVPKHVLADLRRRYAEPQRAYHTWTHIEALLAMFSEVRPQLHDAQAVFYAILFHDAIYDPTRTDNEDRSADLLQSLGTNILDEHTKAAAVRLIMATKTHAIPSGLPLSESNDMAIFLDMDLSILAAPTDEFDRYEKNIGIEYRHVPADIFRSSRARILQEFISRDHLFLSAWGKERFQAVAKVNLARSLRSLG